MDDTAPPLASRPAWTGSHPTSAWRRPPRPDRCSAWRRPGAARPPPWSHAWRGWWTAAWPRRPSPRSRSTGGRRRSCEGRLADALAPLGVGGRRGAGPDVPCARARDPPRRRAGRWSRSSIAPGLLRAPLPGRRRGCADAARRRDLAPEARPRRMGGRSGGDGPRDRGAAEAAIDAYERAVRATGGVDFDDLVAARSVHSRRTRRSWPAGAAGAATSSSTRSRTWTRASCGWHCCSPRRRTGSSSSATTTSRSTAGASRTSAGCWGSPRGSPASGVRTSSRIGAVRRWSCSGRSGSSSTTASGSPSWSAPRRPRAAGSSSSPRMPTRSRRCVASSRAGRPMVPTRSSRGRTASSWSGCPSPSPWASPSAPTGSRARHRPTGGCAARCRRRDRRCAPGGHADPRGRTDARGRRGPACRRRDRRRG